MPTVYIDILFFTNAAFDCLLLLLTDKFSGKKSNPFRVLSGGILGGICGVGIFFANLGGIGTCATSIALSMLLTFATFFPFSKKEFLRLIAGFYMSAFLLGGAMFALFYFSATPGIMSNGICYFPLSIWQLLIAGIPFGIISCACLNRMKNRLKHYGKYCSLTLTVSGVEIELEGLLDSGCMLTDPYTGNPVIVIDRNKSETLLSCVEPPFRLIPFNTVSSIDNLATAFTPDLCVITTNSVKYVCDCTVVISPVPLNDRAIINPDVIINWRNKNDL